MSIFDDGRVSYIGMCEIPEGSAHTHTHTHTTATTTTTTTRGWAGGGIEGWILEMEILILAGGYGTYGLRQEENLLFTRKFSLN